MSGFLDLIQADLDLVDQKIEKAYKIRPGHLSKFAHLEPETLQKHWHPALVIYCGRLFNYTGEKLIALAAVVQFIYIASSTQFRIPDENDPMDDMDPRDGAELPVLVGDYLYGRFFTGLCEAQILEFLKPLAEIIAQMNQGALVRRKNSGHTLADMGLVLNVIEKESALLQEGAARMAGELAGAAPETAAVAAEFGRNLGMAYGILERGLAHELAAPYFAAAHQALAQLPAGQARDCLSEMTGKIEKGELAVPSKKIGRSHDTGQGPDGLEAISEQFKDKEEYVNSIFSAIAEKYDTINTVLSFNQDKHWRRFTVEQTGLKAGGQALDVCCGTGLITVELARKVGLEGRVVGLDFNPDMLAIARKNLVGTPYENIIEYMQGNAMELPFADNSFDCVTIGFGLRNVPDRKKTLRELARVIKPGGRVVCLEFSKPTVPGFKQIYNFYFDKWVPFLGRLGVGLNGPYRYLHNSWKAFPHQKELRDEFARQGLREATFYELTGGVVSVHVGVKPLHVPESSVAATRE